MYLHVYRIDFMLISNTYITHVCILKRFLLVYETLSYVACDQRVKQEYI